MKQTFNVQIEPFSINRVYGRDKRWKTAAYKHWEMRLFMQLSSHENQKKFKILREAYELGDTFTVQMIFYYPAFYNKQGTISAHTEDLSNVEKINLDCFFLEKYSRQPVPYGCMNLCVDDRFVTTLISSKRATSEKKPYMVIKITLQKSK